jgi:hypothetical protein
MNEKKIDRRLNAIQKQLMVNRNEDYIHIKNNLFQILWTNFIIGISRGFGMAVGFTILGAVGLIILKQIVAMNLPLISSWVEEVMRLVQAGNLK